MSFSIRLATEQDFGQIHAFEPSVFSFYQNPLEI
jgi:hypothetical protein